MNLVIHVHRARRTEKNYLLEYKIFGISYDEIDIPHMETLKRDLKHHPIYTKRHAL